MKPGLDHKIILLSIMMSFVAVAMKAQQLAAVAASTPSIETTEENPSKTKKFEAFKHDQKSYVKEDGNIYWNKSLPVYISLLSSPESKDGLVVNVNPGEQAEPYYFDTEGINWIRTRWKVNPETGATIYPKEEVLWPVIADGQAPSVNASFTASGKYVIDGTTYYSGDLSIAISARDATSGVETIYYSLGEDYSEYSDAFNVNTEKEWTLSYYAVDRVGNYSVPSSDMNSLVNFTVDDTDPTTSFKIKGPSVNNILSPKALIEVNGSDDKSGVRRISYKLGEGRTKVYSSAISLGLLDEGFSQLEYSAADNVGNTEESNYFVFYLDRTAPELDFEVLGDEYVTEDRGLFLSGRSGIRLIATDNKAGVDEIQYSVDRSAYERYSEPVGTMTTEGIHQIDFFGLDKVENTSKPVTQRYTVDLTAPVIDYNINGPQYIRHDTIFVRSTTTFNLTPRDEGKYQSGIKSVTYQVGDQPVSVFEDVFSFQSEGLSSLKIMTSDNVSNDADLTEVVFVDNHPPRIRNTFSVDRIGEKVVRKVATSIYPEEVKLYLAAQDDHVGSKNIYYSLNGGSEKLYSTPLTGFELGTNVSLNVRATDLLGNETSTEIKFSVE